MGLKNLAPDLAPSRDNSTDNAGRLETSGEAVTYPSHFAENAGNSHQTAENQSWPRWDSNPYAPYEAGDFKSPVSAIPPRGRMVWVSAF